MTTYTGQPIKRFEDPKLVSGQGSYVDDIKLPGLLHAAILRSPHAHARINRIDVSQAQQAPGVAVVISVDDLEGVISDLAPRAMSGEWQIDEFNPPQQPALAKDKVRYVGQPVVVVMADEASQTRDALDLIQVEYEPLEPIMHPRDAASAGSALIHENWAPMSRCAYTMTARARPWTRLLRRLTGSCGRATRCSGWLRCQWRPEGLSPTTGRTKTF